MAGRNDFLIQDAPYNMEAEQAVLGAIIMDQTVFPEIIEILSAHHFYSQSNQAIYDCMMMLFNSSRPIDYVTVVEEVIRNHIFGDDGEAKEYLYNITQTVPTIRNVAQYAKIVYDKFILRSLIDAANTIAEIASSQSETADIALDLAEQKIYDIRNGKNTGTLRPITNVVMETLEHLRQVSGPDKAKYQGLESGFQHLDKTISGLNGSDLIILAARPGVGKTSFALNVASNVANKYKDKAVAVFSLEMSNMQLVERLLSADSGVTSMAFRNGDVQPEDWGNIAQSASRYSDTRIYLDDTSGITVSEIKAKTRRIDNLGLIVVDYLQLMSGGKSGENRVNVVAEMTRNFKIMAKELNVPVLLLSQLSRSNEKETRAPRLSDLRESGSIEQDADIVLFLYREEKKGGDQYSNEQDLSQVTLMVAKNRHGEVKNIKLHWDGAHTRFTSMEFERSE